MTVKLTLPHHGLSGRFLWAAAALQVALCFWQAKTVLGRRMILVTSMMCGYVALRRLQRRSFSICGSSYLWSFVSAAPTFSIRGGAEALPGMPRAQPWDNSRAVHISGEDHCNLGQNAV